MVEPRMNLALAVCIGAALASGSLALACVRAPVSAPAPPPVACGAPADSATVLPPPRPYEPSPPPVEPDVLGTADVGLEVQGCALNDRARRAWVHQRIAAMRAAVDAEYASWLASSDCELGDRFGAGGVGGLAVRGEGIGLGSAGGIGQGGIASRTNDQVAGVDEADIVKNDGAYVYLAMNGALRVVEAQRARVVSVTRLEGTARSLIVAGDRAVVFLSHGDELRAPCTYAYDCDFAGDGTSTEAVVFDLADRARPKVLRRVSASGSLIVARRIGDAVHLVVADNDAPGPDYETSLDDLPSCRTRPNEIEIRARFEDLKRKAERAIRAAQPRFPEVTDHGRRLELCDTLRDRADDGDAFASVISFDLRAPAAPLVAATVQSRPGVVFVSERALYVAVAHRRRDPPGTEGARRWSAVYGDRDEASDIHEFRVGPRPGDTRYLGSGAVPGHVLNQFAMDEWSGHLRVATSTGRVPDAAAESAVTVLAEAGGGLVRAGAVDHLAPGEDIRAVRFDGDRGYVVTFKKTDPLFVLDLHDASAPRVIGELKIPGFSTYLHRIDPAHLLTIGFDASDHGTFAYFDGLLLQLFDVTNPTAPVLLHREKIGSRGSSSEAAVDHLAFDYLPERALLAVPATVCEGGGDGRPGERVTFSGLLVYGVGAASGFRRVGSVDHGVAGARCDTWWSSATSVVRRSVLIDDLVFSIAEDRMRVRRLGPPGADVADIPLEP